MQALLHGENIIKTYQIDSSDLKLYESKSDYNKGKVNPFEKYTTNETTTNGTVNTNNTSSNNTNKTFFNNTGK